MAIADLKNVLNIFGGADVSEDQQNELFKEVLLMTLARAADADINIQQAEISRIQEILKEHTGEDFSSADIRVAARAELYAEGNLICFRIKASHFLWKMVRRIVGMLAEVGRGKLADTGFQRLLKYPSNVPAKFTAPPSGLFLERVYHKGDI